MLRTEIKHKSRPNPVHVILAEAHSICAAMRLNTRWASTGQVLPEGSLLRMLLDLNKLLKPTDASVLETVDALLWLKPFLEVIRSEETSGPITGVALLAIYKFLSYGIIKIGKTVTHCRFEATDPEADEVVLMLILKVLLECMRCSTGPLLSDDMIIEIVQTCFRMSIQMKFSELLRRTAEQTLLEMYQTVFLGALKNLRLVREPPQEASPSSLLASGAAPGSGDVTASEIESEMNAANQRPQEAADAGAAPKQSYYVNVQGIRFQKPEDETHPSGPYGIASLNRLFRFMCSLISSDRDVEGRLLGLQLINAILETCGSYLENSPAIITSIKEDLFKFLLQNLSTDHLYILSLTLRAFYNLYGCLREHLKFQLEIFFNTALNMLENRNCSYEKHEIILETLSEFCRDPSFPITLYLNYDCDVRCTNVLENFCRFLYKITFPTSGSLFTIQLLSLDALLSIVNSIAARIPSGPVPPPPEPFPSTEELRKRKHLKVLYSQAAEIFNKNPKEGIEFLKAKNIIPNPPDPQNVALFLRNTLGLNKTLVGEYLGKSDEFNVAVLKAYIESFDCHNANYIMSLRALLESFRLPGESQIINRILELWGKHYYDQNPNGPFRDADAAYILAYALIMLHVDHHNRIVPKKMTQEEFIRNLKGINANSDLPRDLLAELYHNITTQEIKVADDYPSAVDITNSHWQDLLKRNKNVGKVLSIETAAYDGDIFSAIWKSVVMALSSGGRSHAVEFGLNRKAQGALQVVAHVTRNYGHHLHEGWRNLANLLISMNKLKLLPDLEVEDIFNLRERNATTPTSRSTKGGGFWGWFSGSSSSSEKPSNADSDVGHTEVVEEALKRTREVVAECNLKDIVENSSTLNTEALSFLIKAIILCSVAPKRAGGSSSVSTSSEDVSAVFCLDLLTRVTLLNQDRVIFVWLLVQDHFASILTAATSPSKFLEKALANFLLLCINLSVKEEICEQIVRSLTVFQKLDPALMNAVNDIVARGIEKLLEKSAAKIQTEQPWSIVFHILENTALRPNTIDVGQRIVKLLAANEANISPANFRSLCAFIAFFPRSKSIDSKAVIQVLEVVPTLASYIPSLVLHHPDTADPDGWLNYWRPCLQLLSSVCLDPRTDVRNHAMTFLQSALLSPAIHRTLTAASFHRVFEEILFPLMSDLLKLPRSDAEISGFEETRCRAFSALMSKVFLQYLAQLSPTPNFPQLWQQVLSFSQRYIQADNSDLLAETVRESLKNLILVISAAGYFQKELWQLTWSTIASISQSLQDELLARVEAFLPPDHLPPRKLPPSTPPPQAASAPVPVPPATSSPAPSVSPTLPRQSPKKEIII